MLCFLERLNVAVETARHHSDRVIKSGSTENSYLNFDGAASIALYTNESPFYRLLNCILRSHERREVIQPFVPYIWLFLTALSKCRSYKGRMVYRAIKIDSNQAYEAGDIVVWHSFSSATSNIAVELRFLQKYHQSNGSL